MSRPEELPSPPKKQKNVLQKVSNILCVGDVRLFLNAAMQLRDWLCNHACACPAEAESGKEAGRLLLREELLQTEEAAGDAAWCPAGKLSRELSHPVFSLCSFKDV